MPELLDTRGAVLLRAGRLEDAAKTFSKASQLSSDPRYRFHMIQVLVAQENWEQARQMWEELDRERIDLRAMTAEEKESLQSLEKKFGSQKVGSSGSL